MQIFLSILLGIAALAIVLGGIYIAASFTWDAKEAPEGLTFGIGVSIIMIVIPLAAAWAILPNITYFSFSIPLWLVWAISVPAVLLPFPAHVGALNNYLVGLRETITEKNNAIQILYQKRFDLLPGMARSVDSYSGHEKELLMAIAESRKEYLGAKTETERSQAVRDFEQSFRELSVQVESYPTLNADALVRDMMSVIKRTEHELADARMTLNSAVKKYNTQVRVFPNAPLARMLGYGPLEYFGGAPGVDEKGPDQLIQSSS